MRHCFIKDLPVEIIGEEDIVALQVVTHEFSYTRALIHQHILFDHIFALFSFLLFELPV